jgi:hypothetical protein
LVVCGWSYALLIIYFKALLQAMDVRTNCQKRMKLNSPN